jgi:hypothetical protein
MRFHLAYKNAVKSIQVWAITNGQIFLILAYNMQATNPKTNVAHISCTPFSQWAKPNNIEDTNAYETTGVRAVVNFEK